MARFEVVEEAAHIVRLIFASVGFDRLSLREGCRRLRQIGGQTRGGSTHWYASTIRGMLDNPAYVGCAAFWRAHYLPPRPRLPPLQGRTKPSPHPVSRVPTPCDDWIEIPVAAIVDQAVFEAAGTQLDKNKKRKRNRESGHVWLLQGLTVCRPCGYAYYGKAAPRTRGYDPTNVLRYYRSSDLPRRRAIARQQYDPRPKKQAVLARHLTRQIFKFGALLFRQCDRRLVRNAAHSALNHDSPFSDSGY
jgi:site-specific DNA recombinase